jgi:hypothetical protein
MALSMRKIAVDTIALILTRWIMYLFIALAKKIAKIAWWLFHRMTRSCEVVENYKATNLNTLVDARRTQIVLNRGVEGAKSHWTNLPLALKVSVPGPIRLAFRRRHGGWNCCFW